MRGVLYSTAKGATTRAASTSFVIPSRRQRLTKAQVLVIRRSDLTQQQLANEYGVTQTCISLVRNRITWAHLN
jgi:hypothetical protein